MLVKEISRCQMMMNLKERNLNSLLKNMSHLLNTLRNYCSKRLITLLFQTDLLISHVLLLLILMAIALLWTRSKRLKCSQVPLTTQFPISRKSWKSILITKSTKSFFKRFKYFLINSRIMKSTNNFNNLSN